MTARAEPIGGPLITPAFRGLFGVFGLGAAVILWRLISGLGATTALNDGYPLGLWIAFDVVTGTALACGGYAVAIIIFILNRGEYHPLIRPAILTSALGYSLAWISVLLDVGRWWSLWKVPVYFWHWNFNSALLEIALCIMGYVVVLWIELSPTFLEGWTRTGSPAVRRRSRTALRLLEKSMIWIIALGLLLPTLHQSSLGTLMLLAGSRLHPLWRTPLLPLLFLISCVAMGYAAVVFESALSAAVFHRKPDTAMLGTLARAIVPLQLVFVVLRFADLGWRGNAGLLLAGDTRSMMVWIELATFLAPVAMLMPHSARRDLGKLFGAAIVLMFSGALYRFDTYLVAFNPGSNWRYFPSVPEIAVSVGLVAFQVLAYIVVVKTFPVLAGRPAAAKAV